MQCAQIETCTALKGYFLNLKKFIIFFLFPSIKRNKINCTGTLSVYR